MCIYSAYTYVHTDTHLILSILREKKVSLMPETATDVNCAWLWLALFELTRAQSLCGSDAVSNEAYLHRRGCQFAQNDSSKYIQVSLAHPSGELHLAAFSAAFHLYVHSVDDAQFLVLFAAQSLCRSGPRTINIP